MVCRADLKLNLEVVAIGQSPREDGSHDAILCGNDSGDDCSSPDARACTSPGSFKKHRRFATAPQRCPCDGVEERVAVCPAAGVAGGHLRHGKDRKSVV